MEAHTEGGEKMISGNYVRGKHGLFVTAYIIRKSEIYILPSIVCSLTYKYDKRFRLQFQFIKLVVTISVVILR